MKRFLLIAISALTLTSFMPSNSEAAVKGIVNFTTCITESKYGKNEQSQLENIKSQWSSLIEETDNEIKKLETQFDDQDYLDGLSPEATQEMKVKYQTLNEDKNKYQNQLYQILNQANYFFLQKMQTYISKASEKIASKKKIDMILNKDACFYNDPNLDVTKLIISEMDKSFEKDLKAKKLSENTEPSENSKDSAEKKEISQNEISQNEVSQNEVSKDKDAVSSKEKK